MSTTVAPSSSCIAHPQSRQHPSSERLVTSLAFQLLAAIAGHLPWRAVLSLRKTCRIFRDICWDRAVWRNVYLTWASIGARQSHVLPKPLLRCTVPDLHNAIANWDGEWGTSCAIHTVATDVRTTSPIFQAATSLMPDSRILLLGYCDGSVRYFDLDECERSPTYTPKFLLPPTFSDDPVSVCMHTAYDFSLEGAQSSSPHTRCIDHFNLGTVTNALIQGWRTLV